jgi:hypothetical protein
LRKGFKEKVPDLFFVIHDEKSVLHPLPLFLLGRAVFPRKPVIQSVLLESPASPYLPARDLAVSGQSIDRPHMDA